MNKPKRKNKAPEQATKNAILTWLRFYQNHGFAWTNDTVGIWDQSRQCYRKKTSPFFIRGVSDIIGIWCGIPLFIEVKSKTGRLSEFQVNFLERAKKYGAICIVARSVKDVSDVLENIAIKNPSFTPLKEPPLILRAQTEEVIEFVEAPIGDL